jgi:hypothetical protein
MNRIRPVLKNITGKEDPDDLMQEILGVLKITTPVPDVGKYYTFVYSPKSDNLQYDEYPLVAVTDIFQWGFRGINFHWGGPRQYTWVEIVGNLHLVYPQEFGDLRTIPYGKIKLKR